MDLSHNVYPYISMYFENVFQHVQYTSLHLDFHCDVKNPNFFPLQMSLSSNLYNAFLIPAGPEVEFKIHCLQHPPD